MISADDCVEMEMKSLKKYEEVCREHQWKTNKGRRWRILGDGKTKKEMLEKRRKSFMEKPIHSQFMYEENRCEEPGNLELAKDMTVGKRNRECHQL